MEFHHRNSQSIKSLVELGAKGFFPLFQTDWIEEVTQCTKKLTGNEKVKAKKLLQRVAQHRSIDRKKTIVFSMEEKEREILIKAFLKMVEGKVLDRVTELH